jgi:hypothetical protein
MSHVNERRTSAGDSMNIVERVSTDPDTSTTVSVIRAVAEAESVSSR